MRWLMMFILFFSCEMLAAGHQGTAAFNAGRAGFTVVCESGMVLEYAIQTIFLLPEETITLHSEETDLIFTTQTGRVEQHKGAWSWQAPVKPGIYSGCFRQSKTTNTLQLQLVVLVPSKSVRQGCLNQYRLGAYPRPHPRARDRELPPRGFVEVTAANQHTPLTPHFQLNQFLCKQNSCFPKYICLDEKLLVKLEWLSERVHERFGGSRLVVMSGYRTPYYNRAIGDVAYSSHLWGRAADVYVDDDQDGVMDDLNHDHRHDWRDAQLLYQVADALDAGGMAEITIGGLGVYDQKVGHGPFVHMDTRGYRARWGLLPDRDVARVVSDSVKKE